MAIILESVKDHPLSAEIMVVDDQPTSRVILETILRSIGDNVRVTGYDDPLAALQALESGRLPDLIVADYRMPGIDGIAFTRRLRRTPSCNDIPLVIVTVVEQRSVMYEALEAGATDFLTKPVDHYECKVRCRNLLTLRRQQLIIRHRASAVEVMIHQSVEEVRVRERDALTKLALAARYRENISSGQIQRFGQLARMLANQLGLPGQFCETIEMAAPLHDIGKCGIPDAILLKPGQLTAQEAHCMQDHTRIGHTLLKDSQSPALQMGATIALHHHEAHDGSGYPNGLKGESIPVEGRIVAVLDTFDAFNCAQPCKPARPIPDTLAEMRRLSGARLDPVCVEALFRCTDRLVPGDPASLACIP